MLTSKAAILMRYVSKIKLNVALVVAIFSYTTTARSIEATDEPRTNRYTEIPKLLGSIVSPLSDGLDVHSWDRYVRRFRRDHHLVVSSGWEQGQWHIGYFGALKDETFRSAGADTTFQYSFHIQLSGKIGYILGSSSGYFAEQYNGERDAQFTPSSLWKLPGLTAGIVYNYDATGRFIIGGEAYLARINNLRTRVDGESQQIAVTAEGTDIHFAWDKFVTLNWGIRTQIHQRSLWVPKPFSAEGKLVDASLSRKSRGASVGTIYHFL